MKRLNVYADDILVGHLSKVDATGMFFVYDHNWLTNEATTPLSPDIPLSEQKFQGELVTSFFENLLPEGDVLKFISNWSASESDHLDNDVKGSSVFFLLIPLTGMV